MNLETFTSFQGRIPRKTFWLGIIVLWLATIVLYFVLFTLFGVSMPVMDPNDPAASEAAMQVYWSKAAIPSVLLWLITLWPSLALYAKRWHDRNKSAWWTLIALVPFIGAIWLLIELGFLRGTDGSNRFGADPIPA